jgi:hypothetical protein
LQPHAINWADNLGGEVNIELYRNNVNVGMIVSNTPSDGSYLWTPDAALNSGSGYSLRISSVTNPGVQDSSDATFTLSDAQPLFANGFE